MGCLALGVDFVLSDCQEFNLLIYWDIIYGTKVMCAYLGWNQGRVMTASGREREFVQVKCVGENYTIYSLCAKIPELSANTFVRFP